jgi:mannose/fructose/N-acetylgalactosamine-specific phosphotransferase system component IIC
MSAEEVIERTRRGRQIVCRGHQAQPGTGLGLVVLGLMPVAARKAADRLGYSLLGLGLSVLSDIDPSQADMVCMPEVGNSISAALDSFHEVIFTQLLASISDIILHSDLSPSFLA